MRILIHNQKGGVGKTTTAVNLAAAIARQGLGSVVVADLDPQCHLTAAFGMAGDPGGWTVADWMAGRPGMPRPVPDERGVFVVPGCETAAELPEGVDDLPPLGMAADWVILDTAPAWSAGTARLMRQSQLILTPLEPDFLGMNGVSQMLAHMDENAVPFDRLRLLLCRFSNRLALHGEVRARLMERFGMAAMLPVVIRSSVRLSEAPGNGRTVFNHAPGSTGAADYAALALALHTEGRLISAAHARAAQ